LSTHNLNINIKDSTTKGGGSVSSPSTISSSTTNFRPMAQEIASSVEKAIGATSKDLVSAIEKLLRVHTQTGGSVNAGDYSGLERTLRQILKELGTSDKTSVELVAVLRNEFKQLRDDIKTKVAGVPSGQTKSVEIVIDDKGLLDKIKGALSSELDASFKKGSKVLTDGLDAGVSAVGDNIKAASRDAGTVIRGEIKRGTDEAAKSAGKYIGQAVGGTAGDLLARAAEVAFKKAADIAGGKVQSSIESAGDNLSTKINKVGANVGGAIEKASERMSGKVDSVLSARIGQLKKNIESMSSTINVDVDKKAISDITKLLELLGSSKTEIEVSTNLDIVEDAYNNLVRKLQKKPIKVEYAFISDTTDVNKAIKWTNNTLSKLKTDLTIKTAVGKPAEVNAAIDAIIAYRKELEELYKLSEKPIPASVNKQITTKLPNKLPTSVTQLSDKDYKELNDAVDTLVSRLIKEKTKELDQQKAKGNKVEIKSGEHDITRIKTAAKTRDVDALLNYSQASDSKLQTELTAALIKLKNSVPVAGMDALAESIDNSRAHVDAFGSGMVKASDSSKQIVQGTNAVLESQKDVTAATSKTAKNWEDISRKLSTYKIGHYPSGVIGPGKTDINSDRIRKASSVTSDSDDFKYVRDNVEFLNKTFSNMSKNIVTTLSQQLAKGWSLVDDKFKQVGDPTTARQWSVRMINTDAIRSTGAIGSGEGLIKDYIRKRSSDYMHLSGSDVALEKISDWLKHASKPDIKNLGLSQELIQKLIKAQKQPDTIRENKDILGALDDIFTATVGKETVERELQAKGLMRVVSLPAARLTERGVATVKTVHGSDRALSRRAVYDSGYEKLLGEISKRSGSLDDNDINSLASKIVPALLHPESDVPKQLSSELLTKAKATGAVDIKKLYKEAVISKTAIDKSNLSPTELKQEIEKVSDSVYAFLDNSSLDDLPKFFSSMQKKFGVSTTDAVKTLDSVRFESFYDTIDKVLNANIGTNNKQFESLVSRLAKNPQHDKNIREFEQAIAQVEQLVPVIEPGRPRRGFHQQKVVDFDIMTSDFLKDVKQLGPDEVKNAYRSTNVRLDEMTAVNNALNKAGIVDKPSQLKGLNAKYLSSLGLPESQASRYTYYRGGAVTGTDEEPLTEGTKFLSKGLKGHSLRLYSDSLREQAPFGQFQQAGRNITNVTNAMSSSMDDIEKWADKFPGSSRFAGGITTEYPQLRTTRERDLIQSGAFGKQGYGFNVTTELRHTAGTFEDQIMIGGKLADALTSIVKTLVLPSAKGLMSIEGLGDSAHAIDDIEPKILKALTGGIKSASAEYQKIFGKTTGKYEGRADQALIEDVKKKIAVVRAKDVEVQAAELAEVFVNHFGRKFTTRYGSKGVSITPGTGLGFANVPKTMGEMGSELLDREVSTFSDPELLNTFKVLSEDLKKSGNKFMLDIFKDPSKGIVSDKKEIKFENTLYEEFSKQINKLYGVNVENIEDLQKLYKDVTGGGTTKKVPIDVRISSYGAGKRGLQTEVMELITNNLAGTGKGGTTTLPTEFSPEAYKRLLPGGDITKASSTLGFKGIDKSKKAITDDLKKSGYSEDMAKKAAEIERLSNFYVDVEDELGNKVKSLVGSKFLQVIQEPHAFAEWKASDIEKGLKGIKLNLPAYASYASVFGEKSALMDEIKNQADLSSREQFEYVKALLIGMGKNKQHVQQALDDMKTVELKDIKQWSGHLGSFLIDSAGTQSLHNTLLDTEKFPSAFSVNIPSGGPDNDLKSVKSGRKEPFYVPGPLIRKSYDDPLIAGAKAPDKITRRLQQIIDYSKDVENLLAGSDTDISTDDIKKAITNKAYTLAKDSKIPVTADDELFKLYDAIAKSSKNEDRARNSAKKNYESQGTRAYATAISATLKAGDSTDDSLQDIVKTFNIDVSNDTKLERAMKLLNQAKEDYYSDLAKAVLGKSGGVAGSLFTRRIPSIMAKAINAVVDKTDEFSSFSNNLQDISSTYGDLSISGIEKLPSLSKSFAAIGSEHALKVESYKKAGVPVLKQDELGIPEDMAKKLSVRFTRRYTNEGEDIYVGNQREKKETLHSLLKYSETLAKAKPGDDKINKYINDELVPYVESVRFPFTGTSSIQPYKAKLLSGEMGAHALTVPGMPEMDFAKFDQALGEVKAIRSSAVEKRETLRSNDEEGNQVEIQRLTELINKLNGAISEILPKYIAHQQKLDFDGDEIEVHTAKTSDARKDIKKHFDLLSKDVDTTAGVFRDYFTNEAMQPSQGEYPLAFMYKAMSKKFPEAGFLEKPFLERTDPDYGSKFKSAIDANLFKVHTGPETEALYRVTRLFESQNALGKGQLGADDTTLEGKLSRERNTQMNELLRFSIQKGMDVKHAGEGTVSRDIIRALTFAKGDSSAFISRVNTEDDLKGLKEFMEQNEASLKMRFGAMSTGELKTEAENLYSIKGYSGKIPTGRKALLEDLISKEGFSGFISDLSKDIANAINKGIKKEYDINPTIKGKPVDFDTYKSNAWEKLKSGNADPIKKYFSDAYMPLHGFTRASSGSDSSKKGLQATVAEIESALGDIQSASTAGGAYADMVNSSSRRLVKEQDEIIRLVRSAGNPETFLNQSAEELFTRLSSGNLSESHKELFYNEDTFNKMLDITGVKSVRKDVEMSFSEGLKDLNISSGNTAEEKEKAFNDSLKDVTKLHQVDQILSVLKRSAPDVVKSVFTPNDLRVADVNDFKRYDRHRKPTKAHRTEESDFMSTFGSSGGSGGGSGGGKDTGAPSDDFDGNKPLPFKYEGSPISVHIASIADNLSFIQLKDNIEYTKAGTPSLVGTLDDLERTASALSGYSNELSGTDFGKVFRASGISSGGKYNDIINTEEDRVRSQIEAIKATMLGTKSESPALRTTAVVGTGLHEKVQREYKSKGYEAERLVSKVTDVGEITGHIDMLKKSDNLVTELVDIKTSSSNFIDKLSEVISVVGNDFDDIIKHISGKSNYTYLRKKLEDTASQVNFYIEALGDEASPDIKSEGWFYSAAGKGSDSEKTVVKFKKDTERYKKDIEAIKVAREELGPDAVYAKTGSFEELKSAQSKRVELSDEELSSFMSKAQQLYTKRHNKKAFREIEDDINSTKSRIIPGFTKGSSLSDATPSDYRIPPKIHRGGNLLDDTSKNLRELQNQAILSQKDLGVEFNDVTESVPNTIADLLKRAVSEGPDYQTFIDATKEATDLAKRTDNQQGLPGNMITKAWKAYRLALGEYYLNKIAAARKELIALEEERGVGMAPMAYAKYEDSISRMQEFVKRGMGKPSDIYTVNKQHLDSKLAESAGVFIPPAELIRQAQGPLGEDDQLGDIFKSIISDAESGERMAPAKKTRAILDELTSVNKEKIDILNDREKKDFVDRMGSSYAKAWDFQGMGDRVTRLRASLEKYKKFNISTDEPDKSKNIENIIKYLKSVESAYLPAGIEPNPSSYGTTGTVKVPKWIDPAQQQAMHTMNIQKLKEYYGKTEEEGGAKVGERMSYTTKIFDETGNVLKNIITDFYKYGETIDETGKKVGVFHDKQRDMTAMMQGTQKGFRGAIVRAAKWGAASTLVYGGTAKLAQSVDTMGDVETAMARIKMVMSPLEANFDSLQESAIKFSKKYGISIKDVLKSMQIFAQQGLSQAEIIDRTKTSTLAANVTTLNAKDATEALTAAMSIFGREGESSMRFMDAWSEVEAKTAVTAGDMANAIKKSASAAKVAGVDFDQLNGIVAAVGSTTRQTGNEVGTSMRFILRRLSAEKGPEELAKMGISTMTPSGELRKGFDVLGDLASKWNSLTSAQKLNIAQAIGGTRQYNSLIVMMDKWDDVLRAVRDSVNSKGSAERRNLEIMNTYQKQIEQTKAAAVELQIAFGKVALPVFKTGLKGMRFLLESISAIPGPVKVALTSLTLFFAYMSKGGYVIGKLTDLLAGASSIFKEFGGNFDREITNAKFEVLGKGPGQDLGLKTLKRDVDEALQGKTLKDFNSSLGKTLFLLSNTGQSYNKWLGTVVGTGAKGLASAGGAVESFSDKLDHLSALATAGSPGPVLKGVGALATGAAVGAEVTGYAAKKAGEFGGERASKFVEAFASKNSDLVKSISPLIATVIGLGYAFNGLNNKYRGLLISSQDYEKSVYGTRRAQESELSSIRGLLTNYDTLSSKLKNIQASRDPNQKSRKQELGTYVSPLIALANFQKEVSSTTNSLATSNLGLIAGYDKLGNAILSTKDNLKGYLKVLEKVKLKDMAKVEIGVASKHIEALTQTEGPEKWKYELRELIKEAPVFGELLAKGIEVTPAKSMKVLTTRLNELISARSKTPLSTAFDKDIIKYQGQLDTIKKNFNETYSDFKKTLSNISTDGLNPKEISNIFNNPELKKGYQLMLDVEPRFNLNETKGKIKWQDVLGADVMKRVFPEMASSFDATSILTTARLETSGVSKREGKLLSNDLVTFIDGAADKYNIAGNQAIVRLKETTDGVFEWVATYFNTKTLQVEERPFDKSMQKMADSIFPQKAIEQDLSDRIDALNEFVAGAGAGLRGISAKDFKRDFNLGERFFSDIATTSIIQGDKGFTPKSGFGSSPFQQSWAKDFKEFYEKPMSDYRRSLEELVKLKAEGLDNKEGLSTGLFEELTRLQEILKNNQVVFQYRAILTDLTKEFEAGARALKENVAIEKTRQALMVDTGGLLKGHFSELANVDLGAESYNNLTAQQRALRDNSNFEKAASSLRELNLKRTGLSENVFSAEKAKVALESIRNVSKGFGSVLSPEDMKKYTEVVARTGDTGVAELKIETSKVADNTAATVERLDRLIEGQTDDTEIVESLLSSWADRFSLSFGKTGRTKEALERVAGIRDEAAASGDFDKMASANKALDVLSKQLVDEVGIKKAISKVDWNYAIGKNNFTPEEMSQRAYSGVNYKDFITELRSALPPERKWFGLAKVEGQPSFDKDVKRIADLQAENNEDTFISSKNIAKTAAASSIYSTLSKSGSNKIIDALDEQISVAKTAGQDTSALESKRAEAQKKADIYGVLQSLSLITSGSTQFAQALGFSEANIKKMGVAAVSTYVGLKLLSKASDTEMPASASTFEKTMEEVLAKKARGEDVGTMDMLKVRRAGEAFMKDVGSEKEKYGVSDETIAAIKEQTDVIKDQDVGPEQVDRLSAILDAIKGLNKDKPEGKATGGYIHGPGGPTSDKVNLMASNGEYILNADKTKKLGIKNLDYMNKYGEVPSWLRSKYNDVSGYVKRSPILSTVGSGLTGLGVYNAAKKIGSIGAVGKATGAVSGTLSKLVGKVGLKGLSRFIPGLSWAMLAAQLGYMLFGDSDDSALTVPPKMAGGGIIDDPLAIKPKVSDFLPEEYKKYIELLEKSTPPKMAGGGAVFGPGGPTSDLVPLMASAGEYIFKASAVDKLGLDRLNYMNTTGKIPRFAGGGIIGKYKAGGPVSQDPSSEIAKLMAAELGATFAGYLAEKNAGDIEVSTNRNKAAEESKLIKDLIKQNPEAAQKIFEQQINDIGKTTTQSVETIKKSLVLDTDNEFKNVTDNIDDMKKNLVSEFEIMSEEASKLQRELSRIKFAEELKMQLEAVKRAVNEIFSAQEVSRMVSEAGKPSALGMLNPYQWLSKPSKASGMLAGKYNPQTVDFGIRSFSDMTPEQLLGGYHGKKLLNYNMGIDDLFLRPMDKVKGAFKDFKLFSKDFDFTNPITFLKGFKNIQNPFKNLMNNALSMKGTSGTFEEEFKKLELKQTEKSNIESVMKKLTEEKLELTNRTDKTDIEKDRLGQVTDELDRLAESAAKASKEIDNSKEKLRPAYIAAEQALKNFSNKKSAYLGFQSDELEKKYNIGSMTNKDLFGYPGELTPRMDKRQMNAQQFAYSNLGEGYKNSIDTLIRLQQTVATIKSDIVSKEGNKAELIAKRDIDKQDIEENTNQINLLDSAIEQDTIKLRAATDAFAALGRQVEVIENVSGALQRMNIVLEDVSSTRITENLSGVKTFMDTMKAQYGSSDLLGKQYIAPLERFKYNISGSNIKASANKYEVEQAGYMQTLIGTALNPKVEALMGMALLPQKQKEERQYEFKKQGFEDFQSIAAPFKEAISNIQRLATFGGEGTDVSALTSFRDLIDKALGGMDEEKLNSYIDALSKGDMGQLRSITLGIKDSLAPVIDALGNSGNKQLEDIAARLSKSLGVGQKESPQQQLLNAAKEAADHLRNIESILKKPDKVEKKASGGRIFGEGGPKADKISAYLSNGEYVIKTESARKLGYAVLDHINSTGEVPRFAEGGIVGNKYTDEELRARLEEVRSRTIEENRLQIENKKVNPEYKSARFVDDNGIAKQLGNQGQFEDINYNKSYRISSLDNLKEMSNVLDKARSEQDINELTRIYSSTTEEIAAKKAKDVAAEKAKLSEDMAKQAGIRYLTDTGTSEEEAKRISGLSREEVAMEYKTDQEIERIRKEREDKIKNEKAKVFDREEAYKIAKSGSDMAFSGSSGNSWYDQMIEHSEAAHKSVIERHSEIKDLDTKGLGNKLKNYPKMAWDWSTNFATETLRFFSGAPFIAMAKSAGEGLAKRKLKLDEQKGTSGWRLGNVPEAVFSQAVDTSKNIAGTFSSESILAMGNALKKDYEETGFTSTLGSVAGPMLSGKLLSGAIASRSPKTLMEKQAEELTKLRTAAQEASDTGRPYTARFREAKANKYQTNIAESAHREALGIPSAYDKLKTVAGSGIKKGFGSAIDIGKSSLSSAWGGLRKSYYSVKSGDFAESVLKGVYKTTDAIKITTDFLNKGMDKTRPIVTGVMDKTKTTISDISANKPKINDLLNKTMGVTGDTAEAVKQHISGFSGTDLVKNVKQYLSDAQAKAAELTSKAGSKAAESPFLSRALYKAAESPFLSRALYKAMDLTEAAKQHISGISGTKVGDLAKQAYGFGKQKLSELSGTKASSLAESFKQRMADAQAKAAELTSKAGSKAAESPFLSRALYKVMDLTEAAKQRLFKIKNKLTKKALGGPVFFASGGIVDDKYSYLGTYGNQRLTDEEYKKAQLEAPTASQLIEEAKKNKHSFDEGVTLNDTLRNIDPSTTVPIDKMRYFSEADNFEFSQIRAKMAQGLLTKEELNSAVASAKLGNKQPKLVKDPLNEYKQNKAAERVSLENNIANYLASTKAISPEQAGAIKSSDGLGRSLSMVGVGYKRGELGEYIITKMPDKGDVVPYSELIKSKEYERYKAGFQSFINPTKEDNVQDEYTKALVPVIEKVKAAVALPTDLKNNLDLLGISSTKTWSGESDIDQIKRLIKELKRAKGEVDWYDRGTGSTGWQGSDADKKALGGRVSFNFPKSRVMHDGGLIKDTGPYLLKEGEVVVPDAPASGGTAELQKSILNSISTNNSKSTVKVEFENLEKIEDILKLKIGVDEIGFNQLKTLVSEGVKVKIDESSLDKIEVKVIGIPEEGIPVTGIPSSIPVDSPASIKLDTSDLRLSIDEFKTAVSSIPKDFSGAGNNSVGADMINKFDTILEEVRSQVLNINERTNNNADAIEIINSNNNIGSILSTLKEDIDNRFGEINMENKNNISSIINDNITPLIAKINTSNQKIDVLTRDIGVMNTKIHSQISRPYFG